MIRIIKNNKTKKDFLKKIKEKKEDMTDEDVLEVLFYPYIEPKDIWYSDDEIQYILTSIRKISVKDPIRFKIECENCGELILLEGDVQDFVEYKQNDFPYEDTKNHLHWDDIKNKDSFRIYRRKYPDIFPDILEMLLYIKAYRDPKKQKPETFQTFEEVLSFYEDLTLEESENIERTFNKIKSTLRFSKEVECPKCHHKDKYYFKELPGLLDPLMPKIQK